MLRIGAKAPDFTLPDAYGNIVRLSDFLGKKVILWFFPKASTPGCTMEGQSFRDEYTTFEKKGIQILGVSGDSPKAQRNFSEKHGFQFPMLCDESKEMLKQYQAWGRKKLYGREYDGILRISYIIDEQGNIEESFQKVKTKTHAMDVLQIMDAEN